MAAELMSTASTPPSVILEARPWSKFTVPNSVLGADIAALERCQAQCLTPPTPSLALCELHIKHAAEHPSELNEAMAAAAEDMLQASIRSAMLDEITEAVLDTCLTTELPNADFLLAAA